MATYFNLIENEEVRRKVIEHAKAGTETAYVHVLRATKRILSNSTSYGFKFNAGNISPETPIDVLLPNNDAFIITHVRLSLIKALLINGNSTIGQSRKYQYPEKTVFTLSGTATQLSEADALEAFYNGRLDVKISTMNPVVFPTTFLRGVPPTQNGVNTQAAASVGIDEGVYTGYVPFTPQLLIPGGGDLSINLQLASDMTGFVTELSQAAGANTAINYVSLELAGILIPNGVNLFNQLAPKSKAMC